MNIKIGVVTVLFNSDDVLPGFIKSLANQKCVKYKLYVIDNSGNDSGSRLCSNLAAKHGVEAEIIFNDANLGVACGNNQGIQLARNEACDLVLLANNDVEFDSPYVLRNLQNSISTNRYAAVTPKIYYYEGDSLIWFAGGKFNKLRASTPHFGDREKDVGQYDDLSSIEYSPTCFLMFKASVFDQLGLMDEKYFVYYDDTDFLFRMKQANLRVGFVASEIVKHKVSYSTGGEMSEFSLYYASRNRLYFIRKNYSKLLAVLSITIFLFSRSMKSISMTMVQRKAMWKGVMAGFGVKIEVD